MANIARIQVRTDAALKEQAEQLFRDMGMDMGTAVNMFLAQSVHEDRLPFQPSAHGRFEQSVLATEHEPVMHAGDAESMKRLIGSV